MNIDGLQEKPEPVMEELGVFKLKDRIGRNIVQIDLSKTSRPLTDALNLFIAKIQGANNRIRVMVQWKPKTLVTKKMLIGSKEVIQKQHKDGISQLVMEKREVEKNDIK